MAPQNGPRTQAIERPGHFSRFLLFVALGPPVGSLATLVLQAIGMAISGRHGFREVATMPFFALEPMLVLASYVFGVVPAAIAGILSMVSNRWVNRSRARVAIAPVLGLGAFLLTDALKLMASGRSSLFPEYFRASPGNLSTILLPPAIAALVCVLILERARLARAGSAAS
jgi:hypothetical protein